MPEKILFISHDAFRAGATIVLKHHLEYLKANNSFKFDIALLNGGVLVSEFQKLGKVFELVQSRKNSLFNKILRKLNIIKPAEFSAINLKEYGIIYGNTIVSAKYLKYAKKKYPDKVTVCHVHEMDFSIKYYVGAEAFLDAVPFIDFFLAASKAVRKNLIEQYHISENRIKVHYEYIPIPKLTLNATQNNDIFKICGCGTTDWRKGIDIFIRTVYQLKKRTDITKIHFYWLGAYKGSIDYEKAMLDIEKFGISDSITLIESNPEPFKIIGNCNLFYLTSREDPFPLVCLEAASLGLPIVCFDQAGGMVEFVSKDNGWVLPYLDTDKFVDLAIELIKAPEEVYKKGLQASEDVKQYDISLGGRKLETFLKNVFVI